MSESPRAKRQRKSRLTVIDGQSVLRENYGQELLGSAATELKRLQGKKAKPSGARSAYMLFSSDARGSIDSEGGFGGAMKALAAKWKAVDKKTKTKYVEAAEKDALRYDNELRLYEAELVAAEERAQEELATADSVAVSYSDNGQHFKKAKAARSKPAKPAGKKVRSEVEQRRIGHNDQVKSDKAEAADRRRAFMALNWDHIAPFTDNATPERLEAKELKMVEETQERLAEFMPPPQIRATLRDYQLKGLRWLLSTYHYGIGAILADEMGLGKTLQTISFIASLKYSFNVSGPHLIVVPLSVMSSWMTEFKRWCPALKVVRLHSADSNERDRLKKEVLTKAYEVSSSCPLASEIHVR
jgi:SNF2 family DNA or RNA helicase